MSTSLRPRRIQKCPIQVGPTKPKKPRRSQLKISESPQLLEQLLVPSIEEVKQDLLEEGIVTSYISHITLAHTTSSSDGNVGNEMTIDSIKVLGFGAAYTIHKGKFGKEPAAIKIVNGAFGSFAKNEFRVWELLQDSDFICLMKGYTCMFSLNGTAYYFASECFVEDMQAKVEALSDPNLTLRNTEKHKIVWKYVYESAKGLEYMHKKGIIHRNIRPESIVICCQNNSKVAKLAHFEFSKFASEPNMQSHTLQAWLAPEELEIISLSDQIQKSSPKITEKVDVFCLGLVALYSLSLGSHPFAFSEEYQSDYTMNILCSNVKPKIVDQTIDESIMKVCLLMINKNPNDRPRIGSCLEENTDIAFHSSKMRVE